VIEFRAVLGQQGLVGGDHVLAGAEQIELDRLGDAGASDQLDADRDTRVGQKPLDVIGQHAFGQPHRARRRRIQVHYTAQFQVHAHLLGDGVGPFADQFGDAGADGSEADQPNSYAFVFHKVPCHCPAGSRDSPSLDRYTRASDEQRRTRFAATRYALHRPEKRLQIVVNQ